MSLHRASGVVQVGSHQIRIPRTGTVADLLGELRKRVDLSRPDVELRVVEVIMSKIFKVGQQDPRGCRSRFLRTAGQPAPARSPPDPPGWPSLLSLGSVSHLALPCAWALWPSASSPAVCRWWPLS